MPQIQNPILPGFHPDPSILRVGEDYYIATSTFEWFPGVLVYHSKDLVHWRLAARPLDRIDLLDMRGEEASCGVWAPCLSHDGERFHLVYSDVKCKTAHAWDVSNYVTTAGSVAGPWGDRVYLNRCGFDPSMFHDGDGRKWLVTLSQDPRVGRNRFGGIELQEYDAGEKKLVGAPRIIFTGTALGCTEGAHLYRRGGYYYLMCAEGGTGRNHAVTLARSKQLEGPYEVDPRNPMLTSRDKPEAVLQKAGHASLVDTPGGDWIMAHLCSQPLGGEQRCILGRETALQRVEWTDDGWLRLAGGGSGPQVAVEVPPLESCPVVETPEVRDFQDPELPVEFQTLREPPDPSWLSLTERTGWLRLYGRHSLYSNYGQSLVGRRGQHFHCQAETRLEFDPRSFQQAAGLAAYYDDNTWYYLCVTYEPELGRVLKVITSDLHRQEEPVEPVELYDGPVYLRATLDHTELRFAWRQEDERSEWADTGLVLDASKLSDDYGPRYRFTGAFFVLCAQDATNLRTPADFGHFRYSEL